MDLKDTVDMMLSCDYKDRFKSEYYQLENRINGLRRVLEKYKSGTLSFELSCSYDLLLAQFKAMEIYKFYLEERAEIEKINL